MLVDLRALDMIGIDALALKNHARSLSHYASYLANNRVVYLVANTSDYGMMRMFSVYLEIEGVRTADHVQITGDCAEALDWIALATGNRAMESDTTPSDFLVSINAFLH